MFESSAAGNEYSQLVFKNTTTSRCELFGYPGVSFRDRADNPIGVPATRVPGVAEVPVLVDPDGNAYAEVDVLDPEEIECPPGTPVISVLVYPPGDTEALTVGAYDGMLVCTYGPNLNSASQVRPVTASPQPGG